MAQSYHRSQRLIIAVIVGKAAHGSRLPPGTSPISKLNRTWNWLRSKTGGQRAGGRRPGERYRQRSQRRHREPAGAVGRQPPCQTPGYAASRDTQVVIRVSSGFWQWHLGILDWLDKAGVKIYGIEVSAWRIGDTIAPHFELVGGSGARLKRAEKGAGTAHVAYGRFFRPLTRQLRGHWFQPMGGRQGGWAGRNSTFRTGHEVRQIYYVLQVGDDDGLSWAWLYVEKDDHQAIFKALYEYRVDIDAEMEGARVEWVTSKEGEIFVGWNVNGRLPRRAGGTPRGN